MKQTVESKYRYKKWSTLGKSKNAEWVYRGAIDGTKFYNEHKDDIKKLMLSYDFIAFIFIGHAFTFHHCAQQDFHVFSV